MGPEAGPWFAATGHSPDLYAAAREALRGVLAYLGERHGLARQQACIRASACVDLRLSQIVKCPHLNLNPALKEWNTTGQPPGAKFMRTLWLCHTAGGPVQYTGKKLGGAHAHPHITSDPYP